MFSLTWQVYSLKKEGQPCASGLLIFLQQVYYLLIADPPGWAGAHRGGAGEAAPGSAPQWLSTWSHIKSVGEIRMPGPHSRPLTPAWGPLGQGSLPPPRLPAAQPRWRSSSGGAGQSSSTPSCLNVTSSCFSSLWFCYKFKAKLKM